MVNFYREISLNLLLTGIFASFGSIYLCFVLALSFGSALDETQGLLKQSTATAELYPISVLTLITLCLTV